MEADLRILKDFPYTADSAKQLSGAKAEAEKAYGELSRRKNERKAEIERNRKQADEIGEALHQNKGKTETALGHIQAFAEFLKRNMQYVTALKRKRELDTEITDLEKQITDNRSLCRDLEIRLNERKAKAAQLMRELDDFTRRRDKLGDPQPAEPLTESLPVLEDRYRDILSQRSKDEKLLQARMEDAAKAEAEAQRILRRYRHLSPAQYENLSFSEEALNRALEREQVLEGETFAAQKKQAEQEAHTAIAKERLADTQKALHATGLQEPMPKEQIFGDYERRRQEAKKLLNQFVKERSKCDRLQNELVEKASRILNYIDPGEVPPLPAPRQGTWEDIDIQRLGKTYKQADEENKKARQTLWIQLNDLRQTYSDKHPILSQYLKNIPLEETAATYDAYYFVYERMAEQSARLQDTLTVLKSDLAHLETDKKNIVRHALIQGQNLYDGLRRLSNGSFVKIWPDSPPRQTLKIGIPETLDGNEEERMTAYVETCIATLRAEKSAGSLTEETLRKRIANLFSDRELLCQVLNTAHIPVWLYKVDRIPANSKLRSWEEVLVENSGGELFVSCFVLISALMSYRRDSIMGKSGAGETTRAFLIDNPFGKTSSRHLLEAMLRIARKFRTQMICLSDLNQSSITNRFALIYQLSVRQALYSRNSYLKTDEVRRNGDVHPNERLEHAVLRTPSEQMSLFQEQL